MTFPLPVKVAYCLFCLCVHLFPGGEEGALFYYDIYYFEYICLFIILPGYRFCRFFLLFVVVLSFIWFLYVGCVYLKCFLVLF